MTHLFALLTEAAAGSEAGVAAAELALQYGIYAAIMVIGLVALWILHR